MDLESGTFRREAQAGARLPGDILEDDARAGLVELQTQALRGAGGGGLELVHSGGGVGQLLLQADDQDEGNRGEGAQRHSNGSHKL